MTDYDDVLNRISLIIDSHNLEPKDFMFVFPNMKSNTVANELETKLNKYIMSKSRDEKQNGMKTEYEDIKDRTEELLAVLRDDKPLCKMLVDMMNARKIK